jgi:hypothetical protein
MMAPRSEQRTEPSSLDRCPMFASAYMGRKRRGEAPSNALLHDSRYAAFLRLLTLRRSAALGDFPFACCARFPPSEICFLRAFSRETSLPPLRLAGFLRQLPSSCSLLPGTGSYPGQHREDLAYDLFSVDILFPSRKQNLMHTYRPAARRQ